MHYIAFDVSKRKIDGVISNLRTKEHHFSLPNTREAIEAWLASFPRPRNAYMGCESTAGYHLALARACTAHGHPFVVLNPLLTKQFIRTTVRKQKTDKGDAVIIAKLIAQGNGRPFCADPVVETAKVEQRMLGKLAGHAQMLKRMGQSLEEHEPTAGISALGGALEDIRTSIDAAVRRLTASFKRSYGTREEICLLMSIPGIGFRLAFVIWSELGDTSRFSSPKQVVAYAGLDPKVRQSGHTLNSQGKLTKRGSPRLRHALFLAATVARRFDPQFMAYYEKKRSEGKRYTVAVVAAARKMAAVVYAVLRRKTPFIPKVA